MSRARACFVPHAAVWTLALLFGGCGASPPVDVETSRDDAAVRPANLPSDGRFIARPIEDLGFRLAASVVALPPVDEPEDDSPDDGGRSGPPTLYQLPKLTDTADKSGAVDDLPSDQDPRSTAPGEHESADDQVSAPGLPSRPSNVAVTPPAEAPRFADAYAVHPKPVTADEAPPLAGASEPTPELVAVARQADAHIARGIDLAQRGATYSARAEFLRALRLSVAGLDAQRRTTAHTRVLENALCALAEVEDFLPALMNSSQSASLAAIMRGHRTTVFNDTPADEMSAPQAFQSYLTCAQNQLAAAAGDLQPAASALYALGKLEMTAASMDIGSLPSARAAVYLQAALVVNPRNALAANELGVLFARRGRLEQAKAAFLHCVQFEPLAAAWRNLAIVHRGLGESELAESADRKWRQIVQAQEGVRTAPVGKGPGGAPIQWVDPTTFAQSARIHGELAPSEDQSAGQATGAQVKAPVPSAKTASPWSPWHSRAR